MKTNDLDFRIWAAKNNEWTTTGVVCRDDAGEICGHIFHNRVEYIATNAAGEKRVFPLSTPTVDNWGRAMRWIWDTNHGVQNETV